MIAECRPGAEDKSLILKGILFTLCAAICLSGCAVKPLVVLPPAAQLEFQAAGKFGIKDGDKGYSARFSWQQYNNGYVIEVWGPLGQGHTSLLGDAHSMQVRRGAQLLAEGSSESVMYTHLGWSVPINVLPAWLQGKPAPILDYVDAAYDPAGQFTEFRQAGWQVALERYTARDPASTLPFTPARIVAQSGARRVIVAVSEFSQ